MKKVIGIGFNYVVEGNMKEGIGFDGIYRQVGNRYQYQGEMRTVEKIIEHRPMGEGDKWFHDIHWSGEEGYVQRIFNADEVVYQDVKI